MKRIKSIKPTSIFITSLKCKDERKIEKQLINILRNEFSKIGFD